MSIEAILWDFGGVLTTSPFEALNRFEAANGIPSDFIRRVNATNPDHNAWALFESNRISVDEFDQAFAKESELLGHRVSGRAVIEHLGGTIRPRMVETLRRCKAIFRVACITNNLKPGIRSTDGDAQTRNDVQVAMALFEVVVESSVEGIRKPDPRIYQLTCERLGVEPANAIFLDDLGVNLKPARALGMHTIKVLNEDQAIADLAQITGLTL